MIPLLVFNEAPKHAQFEIEPNIAMDSVESSFFSTIVATAFRLVPLSELCPTPEHNCRKQAISLRTGQRMAA